MKRILLFVAFLTIACGAPEEEGGVVPQGNLSVYVVNYPLQYFAERIGGKHAEVSFPAPADGDPAFWKPDAGAIAAYQQADLILLNGATYAKWVDRATLPASKLVDTSASFREHYIIIEGAVLHSHGPEGEHSHGETAFTTWIDPLLAVEHAKAVRDAMAAARPGHAASFREGFADLERDLLALDERLEKAVAGRAETPLVGSHPVYQYLARRYGLNLQSVHFEPDTFPDEQGWRDLERLLEAHPASTMLWEGAPTAETAARLEAMGIESVVFDPCGNRPGSGDYLSVMEANVAGMEAY